MGGEKAKVEEEETKFEEEKTKFEEEITKEEEDRRRVKEEIGKLEGKMFELRKLVECPVCLMTPREGPVPCCPQGHLICVPCLSKLKGLGRVNCPTCRGPMGQGKSRLAFAVAEQVQDECRQCRHQGCTRLPPFDQIEQHEGGCDWRLIACPSNHCRAMIPFCRVETHAQECAQVRWPPSRISEEGVFYTSTKKKLAATERWCPLAITGTGALQFKGFIFFLNKKSNGGNFTVDVVMKGSKENCKGFMIEASIIKSGKSDIATKATFPPRPLEKDYKEGYCLSVPEEVMSGLWEYSAEEDQYTFSLHVKIVKLG